MKRNNLILVTIAILAVAGLGAYAMISDDSMSMMSRDDTSVMQSDLAMANTNSSTYREFATLKGEEYDRLFIANMIAHHQGAVDMAELALTNAKHQELKDLAATIVSAQTNEIEDMISWQKEWGYPSSSGEMMMDHSAMGMMTDMGTMTDTLRRLSGDAFDRQFLSSMIQHHQSAIDMAVSGEANAFHEELKTLTKAIVKAQSSEIAQMKQWQKEWGYDI